MPDEVQNQIDFIRDEIVKVETDERIEEDVLEKLKVAQEALATAWYRHGMNQGTVYVAGENAGNSGSN